MIVPISTSETPLIQGEKKMNKLAAITAFLGGQKNRYMQYEPNRSLEEKMAVAAGIEKLDGLELCYPADFADLP